MKIEKIEEAKKYLNKAVYTAHNFGMASSKAKNKVAPLYIGGITLFFNQVNYEVTGFELYENKKCTKGWGEVKLDRIYEKFDSVKNRYASYFFSKDEAEKYCIWLNMDETKQNKDRDVSTAKDLLKEHGVKFEIFD